ncbi:hypothetical protein SscP1EGY_46 [Streptomyces phage SscP1EGY]|nr:hypothetical protein SscP1EGY_46 [Streptomyces phage SscP1EGY]
MLYEFLRVFFSSLAAGLLSMKAAGKLWDWWHSNNS